MTLTPELTSESQQTKYTSVNSLFDIYNSTKKSASKSVAALSGSFTLEGMDSINKLVAEAMSEIKAFTDNGKEKSFMGKATSRSLALIDPNNKWAGKWFNNASDHLEEEKLKERTINEIIDSLIEQINKKRDEVIEFVQAANEVKKQMLTDISTYESILAETKNTKANTEPDSKEAFDAEYLISMLKVTIEGLKSDIKSQVDPLIGGARISVQQITSILPTIENDLKYKSGFKAFQQALSDLNGIVKTTVSLASDAGDVIRKDINETIYSSLEMISETGLDSDRLARVHKEEAAHQAKINDVMTKTQAKMQQQFKNINQLSLEMSKAREEQTNSLLENYAKVEKD